MYKETAEFIIGEITKQRIPVFMTNDMYSHVDYDVHSTNNIADKVTINGIYLTINNSYEAFNLPIEYPTEARILIEKYGTDLFVILHEIGHPKTIKGLSVPAIKAKRKKLNDVLDYREHIRQYRNLPSERRADKWALNWLLKHPKEADYYSKMLELARES